MKIAIGCDPNAEEAKQEIIAYIEKKGYGEVTDFGSEDPIYANVAVDVAEHVASGEYDRGVLICGTGLGVSIAANKVKGAYTIKKCESGKITKEQLQKSIQSWTGHAGHADSYNLRKKIETLAEAAIEKAA